MDVITGVKEFPVLTSTIQGGSLQVGEASCKSSKACKGVERLLMGEKQLGLI